MSKEYKNIESKLSLLYNQYSDMLYYYTLGYVHESEIAKEITQDSFLKLWKNYNKVDDYVMYLRRIARNLSLNYIRDEKRKNKLEQLYIDNEQSVEKDIEDIEELVKEIKILIEDLPEKCQRIFILKCVEGLKYHEIAEDMNISVNTVKFHLKTANKRIREQLREKKIDISLVIIIFLLKNI